MGISDFGLPGSEKPANITDTSFITTTNLANISFAENVTTNAVSQNLTTLPHRTDHYAFSWLMNVYLVATAFIIIFGLLGNVLVIMIMRREPFKVNSYGIHLTALAVADMLSLTTFTLIKDSTIYLMKKDVLAHSLIVCKIFFYVHSSTRIFASSITAVICVERFIAVWFPFTAKRLLAQRSAFVISGCIFVTANVAGIFNYLESVVKYGRCLPFDDSTGDISIPFYAMAILFVIVQTLILLLLTPLTILRLVRHQLLRRRMTNNSESGNEQLAYMTAMLVGSVIAYIVLVSGPFATRLVLSNTGITLTETQTLGLSGFFIILEQLNCAGSFVIYGILCSAFRNQFIAVCRDSCKLMTET